MLGGGGFTGGVYQIGALRALDLLSSNRSVNQFDIYVGTSAGLADRGARGQRRHARADDADGQRPGPALAAAAAARDAPALQQGRVRVEGAEAADARARRGPHRRGQPRGAVSRSISCSRWATRCRPGIYTGEGVEEYLRKALSADGRTDDFRLLERELYLAATDLDTCERIVLGAEGWDDIPISAAVRASTALPMIYAPYRVRDRELVDGGIVSTTNLDIAVEAGREVHRRRQSAGAVRQRLLEDDPDPVRHPRPARLATWASPRSATRRSSSSPTSGCTRWQPLEGALPGRRHRARRARPRRRADVPDEHPQLRLARRRRPARLRVGDPEARQGLQRDPRRLPPARDRDLGHARAQGRAPLLRRAREDPRLAVADHRRVVAASDA